MLTPVGPQQMNLLEEKAEGQELQPALIQLFKKTLPGISEFDAKKKAEEFQAELIQTSIKALPEVNEALKGIAEGMRMQAHSQSLQQKANILGQEAQILKQEAQVLKQEAQVLNQEIEELKKKEQAAQGIRAVAQANLARIKKERQELLTKMFYAIFHGKKEIPVAEINQLFNEYLVKGDLTMEKNQQGKSFPRINSMDAVIQYLNHNPLVKTLNFRHFKNQIRDIPILADFLKGSTISTIAINNAFQEDQEVKNSLDAAIAARNGGLKVQYFASKF